MDSETTIRVALQALRDIQSLNRRHDVIRAKEIARHALRAIQTDTAPVPCAVQPPFADPDPDCEQPQKAK